MTSPASAPVYGNAIAKLFALLARTATIDTEDQLNIDFKGLHIIINVTAFVSGTFTPKIQGKDPVSGVYYDILVGTAISGIGVSVLRLYPGITVVSGVSISDFLPRIWRLHMEGASTPSMTFSAGAQLEQ